MKNKYTNLDAKTEELYILAIEVAEGFAGLFPEDTLSYAFTDGAFEELGVEKSGFTKQQLHKAIQVAIKEITEINKLKSQSKNVLKQLL